MRRIFLFISIILGTVLLANLTCWLSLDFIFQRVGAPRWFAWLVGFFLLAQVAGMLLIIAGRFLGHQIGTGFGRPLLSLVMIWNLLLALPTAVVMLGWAVTWRLVDGQVPGSFSETWRTVSLLVAALPFAIALVAAAVAVWQLGRFRINRLTLAIPHLPPALKGMTIVHLSDLHIGKLTRGRVLDEMVAATNRLDADLIVLTGDLINTALEDLPRGFEILRAMKSRHGLFLCEGNHDLLDSREGFEVAAKKSGLPFLLNESTTIKVRGWRVQLLGLRWGEGMPQEDGAPGDVSKDALHRLLAEREPDDFTILLAHHPDAFNAAAAAGIPLTLAGHTHGGQLMLTRTIGFGSWLYRYWSGVYAKGDSRLVVSNGAGNWFPLRINAPAEIIHLTLE